MTPKSQDRALHKARAVFTAFQAINDTMPIQSAHSFLTVALFEGRSLREYCELSGVSQSTMSRHLLDLGARNRKKEEGYMLIEQKADPQDLRRNVYTLTTKGHKLTSQIVSAMEG